jgi:hypothetical protein
MSVALIVAAVLSSGLFSGLVSALVAHRLGTSRQDREFKRKKIEELYMAMHGFCTTFKVFAMPMLPVMRGKIDYNQALDVQLKHDKSSERYYETAAMPVSIYFHELRPRFERILECRDAVNGVLSDFKRAYEKAAPTSSFVTPFKAAMDEFEKERNGFNEDLFRIAHGIG